MDAVVVDIRTGKPTVPLPVPPRADLPSVAMSIWLSLIAGQLEAAAQVLRRMAGGAR